MGEDNFVSHVSCMNSRGECSVKHVVYERFRYANGVMFKKVPGLDMECNCHDKIERAEHSTSSPQATALSTIQQTAIGGASGAPVSATSFSSTVLGGHRFTVVSIERFEGVIDTAYYLARSTDVLRFDAIDRGADWTNPSLNISTLPAHAALRELLTTLQWQ